MSLDSNPSFGTDERYRMNAHRAVETLWQATGGDIAKAPVHYLNSLSHKYSDGSVSLLPALGKVEFSEGCSQGEFWEVVDCLIKVNPKEWPDSEFIESIPSGKLLYEIEPEFDFTESDWDFATPGDKSDKVELFLKKVIASVYTDGVTSVTDKDGNPPNARNNYLMSPDGKTFSGIFHDAPPSGENDKHFAFVIREKKDGNWEIRY